VLRLAFLPKSLEEVMRRIAVVLARARALSSYPRGDAMRCLICLIGLVFVLVVGSPPVSAQETTSEALESVDCVDPEFLSNALIDCFGVEVAPPVDSAELDAAANEIDGFASIASEIGVASAEAIVFPPYCRLKVDAVFWGGRQSFELAQALKEDHSQCAEYHITVPPRNVRTRLADCARFLEIRDLSSRIHPVAEIRWTSPSGWRAWVVSPTHPDRPRPSVRTFYGAGVDARRRMADCGLDVTRGETWAFNELTEEILENATVVDGPLAGKSARVEVLEFMRGLYDGAPNMPKARGIVFNVLPASDTNPAEATAYKASLQAWLADEPFWSELDTYVDFFAQEVYASPLNWGEAGEPLARRAEYLNDYFHHVIILAEEGPETVTTARTFLRRTYVPLANAGWPHPLLGTQLLSAETMSQFISTQVYAMRHYANSHPQTAPQGRIGFGWAPLVEVDGYSDDRRDQIASRLASAIHESSEKGTNSQMGACGPPGEHVWCAGDVDLAELNPAWKIFASWD
jgi:hypothetical protein